MDNTWTNSVKLLDHIEESTILWIAIQTIFLSYNANEQYRITTARAFFPVLGFP
jgi:hypothetical protein